MGISRMMRNEHGDWVSRYYLGNGNYYDMIHLPKDKRQELLDNVEELIREIDDNDSDKEETQKED